MGGSACGGKQALEVLIGSEDDSKFWRYSKLWEAAVGSGGGFEGSRYGGQQSLEAAVSGNWR